MVEEEFGRITHSLRKQGERCSMNISGRLGRTTVMTDKKMWDISDLRAGFPVLSAKMADMGALKGTNDERRRSASAERNDEGLTNL